MLNFMNSSQLQKKREKLSLASINLLEMLDSWHDVMALDGFGNEQLILFNIKDINT